MEENLKRTKKDLQELQALPLDVKVMKTHQRIKEWVDYFGEDGVYVSFSGGKDSTVLLDITRKLYPELKAMFIDTGLEYPEIRQFVKRFENVDWIKPKKTFKQVITDCGYPFVSKECSQKINSGRKYFEKLLSEYIWGGTQTLRRFCIHRKLRTWSLLGLSVMVPGPSLHPYWAL